MPLDDVMCRVYLHIKNTVGILQAPHRDNEIKWQKLQLSQKMYIDSI